MQISVFRGRNSVPIKVGCWKILTIFFLTESSFLTKTKSFASMNSATVGPAWKAHRCCKRKEFGLKSLTEIPYKRTNFY